MWEVNKVSCYDSKPIHIFYGKDFSKLRASVGAACRLIHNNRYIDFIDLGDKLLFNNIPYNYEEGTTASFSLKVFKGGFVVKGDGNEINGLLRSL